MAEEHTNPPLTGLQRCGKSCRMRWINYLRPDLKRGSFSPQEAALIIKLHKTLGNRWAQIVKHLPGRTGNGVKNFWNSSIMKKLVSDGLSDMPTFPNNCHMPCASFEGGFVQDITNPNLIQNPQLLDHLYPPSALQGLEFDAANLVELSGAVLPSFTSLVMGSCSYDVPLPVTGHHYHYQHHQQQFDRSLFHKQENYSMNYTPIMQPYDHNTMLFGCL